MHFSWLELPNGFFSLFMATWRRLVLAYIHGKAAKCRNILGSKWLKSAKNKFTWCDFKRFFKPIFINFFFNFRFWSLNAIHIQKLSKSCRLKCNQSISRIFWISYFGGSLLYGPTVRSRRARTPRSSFTKSLLTAEPSAQWLSQLTPLKSLVSAIVVAKSAAVLGQAL